MANIAQSPIKYTQSNSNYDNSMFCADRIFQKRIFNLIWFGRTLTFDLWPQI